MTGLTVQSSVLEATGNAVTHLPMAAAGGLAFVVLRNNAGNNHRGHAPRQRRQRNYDDRSPGASRIQTRPPRANSRRRFIPSRQEEIPDSSSSLHPLVRFYHDWMRLPQIVRFGVAGNLGNLGFFYLEKVFFRSFSYLLATTPGLSSSLVDGIEKYQDSLSFFTAYLVQIVTTHLLYAFLVYGMDTIDTYEKYSKTLWGQFKVYGFGLFGATFLNGFLISRGGLDKTVAFWTTTLVFAVFNYFLVSWVVQKAMESSAPKETVVQTNAGNRTRLFQRRQKVAR